MPRTEPKPRFSKECPADPSDLAAKRYGTLEMCAIWGADQTFDLSLKVQGQASLTLSRLHPEIVPQAEADEIAEMATIDHVSPSRIRELEEKTGHDVIAINTALEEKVSHEAGTHINKARTSADTTSTARALQLQKSLVVIADTVENFRDILIEKAMEWNDVPHMDTTHLYDALPAVAGRAFAHYAEMLQTGLDHLKFAYENSIVGKWADATGNHHSATALGIDGIALQRAYCDDLGIKCMDAPAQVPGVEFEADIAYVMARIAETMNNIAKYVALGRGDDSNIFVNASPRRKKGSSAMPHKDAKNGNPTAEEQAMSVRNYMMGMMTTALANCELPYARNLAASSNTRINFDNGFKFLDQGLRRMANVVYWLGLNEERCRERVNRSFGVVTSQQVMTYLTDQRRVKAPMTRSEAHDLMGELADKAWSTQTPFIDILLENNAVAGRLDEATLRKITDPEKYIGESVEIIKTVYDKYHGKKTLEE